MARASTRRRIAGQAALAMLLCVCLAWWAGPAAGDVSVTVSGPGGRTQQTLPGDGGAFDLSLPLTKNTVNNINVTATDALGNTASRALSVTQVSLADVVVSDFTSEPLPVERIEELVNQGVIDLDDPENYNVTEFAIVLTIGNRQVDVSVPIVMNKMDPEPTGYENVRLAWGDAGGGKPPPAPIEIVVFEEQVSNPRDPDGPKIPVPGVLIIEGRIKSLKEFFSCRLLLMNASGIFTLTDVVAELSFLDGGLSNVLPRDGIVAFGDIVPGEGGQPGQIEKEFIIRGDEVGVRRVQVNFGGLVTGPGIPEDAPIPFNGSALTDVEVKGPPSFLVEVNHPPEVTAGQPYELVVDITNTGDMPALYASLDIDVGADGTLMDCGVDDAGEPVCEPVDGPVTRALGHIFPARTAREVFTVTSKRTGVLSSCMGVADQNVTLQVYVGNIGCVVGQFPPEEGDFEGIPTVSVLPAANMLNVGLDTPVAAFFSRLMSTATIVTGEGGTFNVYDDAGNLLPGVLRFDTVFEKTVALWQASDNVTNRLPANTELTAVLTTDILDQTGVPLYAAWRSSFVTTGEYEDDDDAPSLSLTIQPPVLPNFVLPGQVVNVNAYASDQGSGVVRVEARLRDPDVDEPKWELIDQFSILSGDAPPYIFAIDSANLELAHNYEIMATAYDAMGNAQNATIGITVADSADPPVLVMPADPAQPQLQGISLDVTPLSYTGGVREIAYYLDGDADPFHTATLRPYKAHVRTLTLPLGTHTVTAVATDGLGQTGEGTLSFELVENINMPVVTWRNAMDGARYVQGTTFIAALNVEDPVGVAAVAVYLDDNKDGPLTTAARSFPVDTTGMDLGVHRLVAVATNLLGVSNDPDDPASVLEFEVVDPPPGVPPDAPSGIVLSHPANGQVSLAGSSAAHARVEVTNTALGITVAVNADGSGGFFATIEADAGHVLRLVAYDLSQSPDPSAPTEVTVEAEPVLESLTVDPDAITFTALNATRDLVVTAHYEDGGTENVTWRCSFAASDTAVAAVSADGRVAARGRGTAAVTASFGGMEASVAVTVDVVALTGLTVAPSPLLLVALGQAAPLTATAHYSDGSQRDNPPGVTWVSANPRVATVNSSGVATAVAQGQTRVTVYLAGAPPVEVPVVVDTGADPPPTAVILSPANGATVERGQAVTVNVRGDDALGGVVRLMLEVSGATSHQDTIQVSPSSLSVTRSFVFNVAEDAVLGADITLTARAEDTGGHLSAPVSVTLTVSDTTPPAVTILAPVGGTGYNYGDTVEVVVSATDLGGVTGMRVVAEGAIDMAVAATVDPGSAAAERTLSFDVPYGVPDPDVRITAYATDASGNEGASTPVDILLTDADVTPPATVATAVSDPGTGPTVTVTYTVTEGLDDLDHVELYFRRDGHGTYNRYTNADGGNPSGRFFPANGDTGSLVFNATRMGGDGHYAFYTVGVDRAGNREPAPSDGQKAVAPDQEQTIASGTVWTTLTDNVEVGIGDTRYDDVNLRVDGATVTLDGHHAFRNLELLNGAVMTHPAADLDTEPGLDFSAWTVTIDATSAVNVSERGYLGAWRDDNGPNGRTQGNAEGSTYRSGGSYGGLGGAYEGTPNVLYGNLVMPYDFGAGGSEGSSNRPGGSGGGRVQVQAINLIVDGTVSANGMNGAGNQSGSGAGGSVYFVTATLSGTGVVSANGAGYEVGGGGGRVAVHYIDMATMDSTLLRALGGQGNTRLGGNGTVFLRGADEGSGTLVVDGQGAASAYSTLPIPPGYVFDNIILRNSARVVADDLLAVNDSLEVITGSILTHSTSSEAGLTIEADRVFIDETSRIDVSSRGYRGAWRDGNNGPQGLTLGGLSGAGYQDGGSHGGYGANQSNPPYGHPSKPVYLGAGGGEGSSNRPGGNGGGRVSITAARALEVNGAILANGGDGQGNGSGSGAGGSIAIETSMLKGRGSIAADGAGYETGGGGGRVAILYDYVYAGAQDADLDALRSITAAGGHGNTAWGSAGTVLLQGRDQEFGDLYVDDRMNGQTSGAWTPLTPVGFGTAVAVTDRTLTLDGHVPCTPGGLVGLYLNPNIDQGRVYPIVANTETEVTVAVPRGLPYLDAVAAPGDTYAAVYYFDNIIFRRGGFLVLGDQVVVQDTVRIEDHGRLTHYDATTDWTSRLDLACGHLRIGATGSIDVNGRGYLGGHHNGADQPGRTLGNNDGATYRSAGSHGGIGGAWEGTTNATYGSLTDPADLGAGGSGGSSSRPGGDGGGRVRIVADSITVDGVITAGGANAEGNFAGSGAGGSIYLAAGALDGAGYIRANGAGYELGGGGGRVAIHYGAMSLPEDHLAALGGKGNTRVGGNGTVFLKQDGQDWGDLVIDGLGADTPDGASPIPQGYTFDNIILRGRARVAADEPVRAMASVQVLGGSVLTHTTAWESGLHIEAEDVVVDAESAIDVSGKGYRGAWHGSNASPHGETLGALAGARYRSGGSYGGYGGVYDGDGSNPPYGHPADPAYLGSGGSEGSSNRPGGNGGGLVRIIAGGSVRVDGAIRANGMDGSGNFSGSGSGGSVWIDTAVLEGAGSIVANGAGYEVGGGGGRVAIHYAALGGPGGDLNGLYNITAHGGHGNTSWGSAGTVLLRRQDQPHGDLYIDDNMSGQTSPVWTPLTRLGLDTIIAIDGSALTTAGNVALLPNGLVGLEVNPNTSQDQTFFVLSNTEDTVTLDTTPSALAAAAAPGDTCGVVYRFDNVFFRRGGHLVLGDPLIVSDTLLVADHGRLSHYDTTATFESYLDILAGAIEVADTASINVSARGYPGGHRHGAGAAGVALGLVPGATYRSGGSHGGLGGSYEGTPNPVYGDARYPVFQGAGGSEGSSNRPGGDGGGAMQLRTDALIVDGAIAADGMDGAGNMSGSGAGGSIYIETGSLHGTGIIHANGAAYELGGGGGRVAIQYETLGGEGDDLAGLRNITALGGHGNTRWGAAGTVILRGPGQPHGDLYIDDGMSGATSGAPTDLPHVGFGLVSTVTADSVTVDTGVALPPGGLAGLDFIPNLDNGQVYPILGNSADTLLLDTDGLPDVDAVAQPGDPCAAVHRFDNLYFRRGGFLRAGDLLEVTGTVRIDEHGVLTHHDATASFASRLHLTAGSVVVAETGAINVDTRGYPGGHRGGAGPEGITLDFADGSTYRSGGSHGGLGGRYDGTANPVYGDPLFPVELGSGGSEGSSNRYGGDGGGVVYIHAGLATVDGVITAGGMNGGGNFAGSGSGGSILIEAPVVDGAGVVRADGAAYEVGGGGGRIAIYHAPGGAPQALAVTASGGVGNTAVGAPGTVEIREAAVTAP